jgi:hypothetical protein
MQRLELFQSIIQHTDQIDVDMEDDINFTPVRLTLLARLISRGIVFFSHSKSATAGL